MITKRFVSTMSMSTIEQVLAVARTSSEKSNCGLEGKPSGGSRCHPEMNCSRSIRDTALPSSVLAVPSKEIMYAHKLFMLRACICFVLL